MGDTSSSYKPSHPHLFAVHFGEGAFSASLKATRHFKFGETVAPISGTKVNKKAYDTLQCGSPDEHLILDSDLRYVVANHSCGPNTIWDMTASDMTQWHVRAIKEIQKGDSITFFYPSTEWEMDQPFQCACGAESCLGEVKGAKYLSLDQLLARVFVSPSILQMVGERDLYRTPERD